MKRDVLYSLILHLSILYHLAFKKDSVCNSLENLWGDHAWWMWKTLEAGCQPCLPYIQRRKRWLRAWKQSRGGKHFKALAKSNTKKSIICILLLVFSKFLLFSLYLWMWKPSWFLALLDSSVQCFLIYSLQSYHREKRLFFFLVSKLFPKCWACVLIRVLLSPSKLFCSCCCELFFRGIKG